MHVRWAYLTPLLCLLGCDLFSPQTPPSACVENDADCDGFGIDDDCNDNDPEVSPARGERCDGQDTNCDGQIDEGFDEDGDGVTTCDGDCDDTDDTSYSGAVDLCDDGVDNDCNGLVDDGPDDDSDGDGVCTPFDCDDTNSNISPEVPEICDGIDQDCDMLIDEDFDEDGDGVTSCAGDCDDGDSSVFPGAMETCNGIDQDCDGTADSPITDVDTDGDGFDVCLDEDCDDEDSTVFPGGFEIPDGVDDDCDGVIDEGWEGTGSIGLFTPTADGVVTLGGLGLVVSNAGDVNGDGLSDFLASSPLYDNARGRAFLWLGESFDLTAPPTTFPPSVTITGAVEGEELGSSLALVDLDNDGFDDVVVGSPEGGPGLGPEGEVRIFWGGASVTPGSWAPTDADVSILGSYGVERCGAAVASAGDMDNDGRDDLAVGCPWYTTADGLVGRTVLFTGRTRGQWASAGGSDDAEMIVMGGSSEVHSGSVLHGGFDANGDGRDDLAIGSPEWAIARGRVGLKLGESTLPSTIDLDDCERVYEGQTGESLGSWIGSGDLNGDGKDELMLGAPSYNANRGRLSILAGATVPAASGDAATRATWSFAGAGANESVGMSAAIMHMDNDGSVDLVIPSPGWDGPLGGDQGRASIFLGPVATGTLTPTAAHATIVGAAGGDSLGLTLVPLPDGSDDGRPDLILASPYSDVGANNGGRITLVPGFP